MFTKISEAIELLARHGGLLTAIALTLWLSGNLLLNYLTYFVLDENSSVHFRAPMWIEAVFGPIAGATVCALSQIVAGRRVS